MKVWQLIVMGAGVHAILFYSIFDIYFTTPLVHGMAPYTARGKPPAKRLVLFVGDGLRADTLFQLDDSGKPHAPFLRQILEKKGAWGVSHAQGPTESRPSHVALTAGFFEDVSAVTKGWKVNPVPFDSVFNESRQTWGWGSPSVMAIFSRGARDGSFTGSSFSGLGDKDYEIMDNWVFEKVQAFFAEAEVNPSLKGRLNEDKLVIFLHLQSSDSSGQTNLPRSREYAKTVGHADEGIGNMTRLIEKFYKDDSTAYIVTADHGMADWGYHGSDSPQETQTPLVAWGAGIRGPEAVEQCGQYPDDFCQEWRLNHRSRVDVQQIDVAPLMAYLAGVPYPVNSRGELPVSYLGVSDERKAEAMYTNAEQMIAQYKVKMAQVKNRTISAAFRPFRFMDLPKSYQMEKKQNISAEEQSWIDQSGAEPIYLLRNIRNLIDKGRYKDAITESQYVVRTAIKGLRYYHTYDRTYLRLSITLGFLGWMVYVLLPMISLHTPASHAVRQRPARETRKLDCVIYVLFATTGVMVAALLYIQSLPRTSYFYCLLPVLLWMKVTLRWREILLVVRKAMEHCMLLPVLFGVVWAAIGLLFIMQCLRQRELMSVGLGLMAFWVLTTTVTVSHKLVCVGWLVSCAVVAVFPLLPVAQRNANFLIVFLSVVVAVSVGVFITLRIFRSQTTGIVHTVSRNVHFIQLLLVAISTLVVGLIQYSIGPPEFLHKISWTILGVSLVFPLLTSLGIEARLFSLCLACLAPYILMSITYESLFMLSFMCLLYFWLKIERQLALRHTQEPDLQTTFGPDQTALSKAENWRAHRSLQVDDLRLVLFYLFFIVVSFFGTQNIASINRFDPGSLGCFRRVSERYVMNDLVILKLGIPFVVATCMLNAVRVITRMPLRALAMLIFLVSDFMGLVFLFLVRDFGTWQQVGTSIAHYIISLVLATVVILVMGVCRVLASFSLLSCVLCLMARLPRA